MGTSRVAKAYGQCRQKVWHRFQWELGPKDEMLYVGGDALSGVVRYGKSSTISVGGRGDAQIILMFKEVVHPNKVIPGNLLVSNCASLLVLLTTMAWLAATRLMPRTIEANETNSKLRRLCQPGHSSPDLSGLHTSFVSLHTQTDLPSTTTGHSKRIEASTLALEAS